MTVPYRDMCDQLLYYYYIIITFITIIIIITFVLLLLLFYVSFEDQFWMFFIALCLQ